jgi:hypothetical protein
MKKILLIACGLMVVFAACKKDPDVVSKVVTVSAPDITLNGDKFVSVMVGAPYTDPGAVLTDDVTGAVSTIMADTPNDINTAVPGMYTLTYSALNANGYGTTAARYIAVTNYPDNADLSGTYVRQSNGVPVTVSREARALYSVADFGGAGIPSDIAYFAVIDTNTIDFGNQYSETVGPFTVDVDYFHMRPGDTSFAYVLHAAGYGTPLRVFVKE